MRSDGVRLLESVGGNNQAAISHIWAGPVQHSPPALIHTHSHIISLILTTLSADMLPSLTPSIFSSVDVRSCMSPGLIGQMM